ncbi:hypothetical protein HK104_002774 [Borealophlyctis nickersoniae]|nr:hypothetical protein HK104_002774 [Borealophlyctis nickersoniae]
MSNHERDERRALFVDLFGDDSSDEEVLSGDEDGSADLSRSGTPEKPITAHPNIIHHDVINGLRIVPGLVPKELCQSLFSRICEEACAASDPVFDQMIANYYEPGDGLTFHSDLLRFEDGIIVVSVVGTCIMEFRKSKMLGSNCCRRMSSSSTADDSATSNEPVDVASNGLSGSSFPEEDDLAIPILLSPGDVIGLSGCARYHWEHGIPGRKVDEWEGRKIPRSERVSITLRRLKMGDADG